MMPRRHRMHVSAAPQCCSGCAGAPGSTNRPQHPLGAPGSTATGRTALSADELRRVSRAMAVSAREEAVASLERCAAMLEKFNKEPLTPGMTPV